MAAGVLAGDFASTPLLASGYVADVVSLSHRLSVDAPDGGRPQRSVHQRWGSDALGAGDRTTDAAGKAVGLLHLRDQLAAAVVSTAAPATTSAAMVGAAPIVMTPSC